MSIEPAGGRSTTELRSKLVGVVLLAMVCGCSRSGVGTGSGEAVAQQTPPPAAETPDRRVVQPVQDYFLTFEEKQSSEGADINPFRYYTHVGSDYGPMPDARQVSWRPHEVVAGGQRRLAEWRGMWHSLRARAVDTDRSLDMSRCYPYFIEPAFQPRCLGVTARVKGKGTFKLELKSAREPVEQVLWQDAFTLNDEEDYRDITCEVDPARLSRVKLLSWVAEAGSSVVVDSVGLLIELPDLPFEQQVFASSYAKLALCYDTDLQIVSDRAHFPARHMACVPTTGMFALATCAAWKMGMVQESFARETLRGVHQTVSEIPRARGLLPHFVQIPEDATRFEIIRSDDPDGGVEYSSVDTALWTHSMLLAATMLQETELAAQLLEEIEAIDFAGLRDAEGFILHGVRNDGKTPLESAWHDWGGETALVLLLARMAGEPAESLKMDKTGRVFRGCGFIPEIQSLFYDDFNQDRPDALTEVNWLTYRKELLAEQRAAVPGESEAAGLGVYGYSASEGPDGIGYVANGAYEAPEPGILAPHYMLLSGALRDDPAELYRVLAQMQREGLFGPWGLVENVRTDMSGYLPMLGALNASFEALSAYHLWAKTTGATDEVYGAASSCEAVREAMGLFYP